MYNKQGSLNTRVFWKSGVLMAAVDAALAFFIPYYSITASDHNSITDVYSVGKTVFIALLGAVSLEVGWLVFRVGLCVLTCEVLTWELSPAL